MLSYSSVLPDRKVTLPSVEMWNTNMNIVKDPPKGIFTRRKDKVGQTQLLLMQQDDAGSRVNEFINVYARNVNPMVGVSYNNYGNTNSGRKTQATLPYKVDVVRPPIMSLYDLYPLSRLPRDWFYASTNPEFPGVIQNLKCDTLGRSIDANNIRSKIDVSSNKFGVSDTVSEKLRDYNTTKTNNKTLLSSSCATNKTLPIYKSVSDNKADKKSVRFNSLYPKDVISSRQSSISVKMMDSEKKLNNPNLTKSLPYQSNPSSQVSHKKTMESHLSYPFANRKNIENVESQKSFLPNRQHLQSSIPTLHSKMPHSFDVQTTKTANIQRTLLPEKTPILERNMPMREDITSVKLYPYEKDDNHASRDKYLQPRLSIGGFENPGSAIPNPMGIQDREMYGIPLDHAKTELRNNMRDYIKVV
jgi:hypothetical protein